MDTPDANQEMLAQWVKDARNKDPQALSSLCAHYYPKILRYMRYRVGPNEADDLTGEVFVKVMRSIKGQSGSFDAWLYRLARNVVIDRARYRHARPETELTDVMMEQKTNGTDLQATSAARMDMESALAMLNEEHRELLTLKFVQGMSNAEIAGITGQSIGAIRAMQFRALNAMRAVLDRKGTGQ